MPQTLRGSFEQALKPLPSVVKGVQACRLPGLKCLKRCAAASSRHSSHCPNCLKRSAAASTRHSGHCPLLLRAFKPAVCQASNASNAARQLRAGTQATALCCQGLSSLPFARPQMPQMLRGSFEQALRPLPSVVKGVQACRLPGLKCLRPLPSVVKGVQACRLPGLKCLKCCAAASSRHSGHCPLLFRAFKPAVCQASNASNAARQLRAGTQATALCC